MLSVAQGVGTSRHPANGRNFEPAKQGESNAIRFLEG
jgi:hypothetical protein